MRYTITVNISVNPPYSNAAMMPVHGGLSYHRNYEFEAPSLMALGAHFDKIDEAIDNEFTTPTNDQIDV